MSLKSGNIGHAVRIDPAMTTMGWQQTPPDGHSPHLQTSQQQLSVVTTVWGVTTTTQSGPLTHSCYAGTNISTAQTPYPQNQHGYLGNSEDIPSKVYPLQNMAGRPVGLGYSSYKMAPTSVGGPVPSPGNGHHVNYQNSSGALSAAALVARAAATATATATASVVAFKEQQPEAVTGAQYSSGQMHGVKDQQQYHGATGNPYLSNAQMENSMISMNESSGVMSNSMINSGNSVNPFDSQMGMNESMSVNNQLPKVGMQLVPNMGSGGSSMYPGPTVEIGSQHRNRATPYPSPVQHLAEKRHSQYSTSVVPQYNANMQPYGFDAQHSYGPSQYSGAQSSQFVKQPHHYSPFLQQQPLPSTPYPSQQTVQPSMRPPFMAQQNQYYPSAQMNSSTPQQMLYEQQTYNGNTYSDPTGYQHRLISYQQSPVSAHPTPPPLTSASVITSCFTSNHGDIKSMVHQEKYDEMRLTFPVRDGTILPSFRLEHNLAVSNHFFQLKPSIYQTLLMRSDLELQLKCFHHEDRQMSTNWPSSVQVSINAIPITIDRGENKTSHRPLYVKKMSQSGRNTIQITVTACCCSHLFLLQLVHRPTLRSVVQGLLRKRLLPAELCVLRIKRNFNNVASASGDGVEQTAIKVSLKCPITFKRINLPARGEDCKHIQCFDVQSYLQLNCERESWRCPVCNKTAMLEKLEIDQYMWAVLNKLSKTEVEEITIDDLASWKPVSLKLLKEEQEQDACGGQKLFKAMSPGSMTMPTSNSWDAGQAMSPYSSVTPPDMNSIANDHVNSGANYRGIEGNYDFPPKFSGPLSNLSDSVTSLDPLVAMETSLNQHEQQMCHSGSIHDHPLVSSGPATTTTPSSQQSNNPASQRISQHRPLTPRNSGPPCVPSSSSGNCCSSEVNRIVSNGSYTQSSINNNSLPDASDLSDLNIAAIFDSDSQGPEDDNDRSQEDLNLLPETVVDPMELLSYLEPPTLCGSNGNSCTTTSTAATNNSVGNISTSNSTSEDILSLFET